MTYDDVRTDPGYQEFVKGERFYRAARADLDREEAQALWVPPPIPKNAYDQLADGVRAIDFVVDGLWTGVAQVNAQKKSGKTTLAMNAMQSLLTGEAFLGRFAVNTTTEDRVAYLNMELTQAMFLEWTVRMQIADEHLKRLDPYHAREHGAVNFRSDLAVEWLIKWLRSNGITLLVIDPLSSIYNPSEWGTSDPNAAYGRFFAVLEDVVRQANLRGVLIVHHTGFSEDAANRARGASAMMDKPDVNWAYRYNVASGGSFTDKPGDNKRYLSAFGRGDVDIDEFEIDYNAATRRLYATGTGSRREAAKVANARRFYDAVRQLTAEGAEPTKADVYARLDWSTSGSSARDPDAARKYAIDEGWVNTRKGPGNSQLHSVGDRRPCGYGDASAVKLPILPATSRSTEARTSEPSREEVRE
ncbi:AAA family ATPase [Mycobacterium neumannii]|uniref:AAA family ATPase n=1 Tax=Mycobacterium neumannii TaxID=2048551 RepID=UPI003AB8432B